MYSSLYTAIVATLLLLTDVTSAFAPRGKRSGSSELHLLPTQGPQLVAAYHAKYCDKNKNDDDVTTTSQPPQQQQRLTAARSFVSRVFSAPSSLLHPKVEGVSNTEGGKWASLLQPLGDEREEHEEDDVVLYPIVGFCLITVKEGVRALPTVSHPSCSIHNHRKEEVYGWYSPACRLS